MRWLLVTAAGADGQADGIGIIALCVSGSGAGMCLGGQVFHGDFLLVGCGTGLPISCVGQKVGTQVAVGVLVGEWRVRVGLTEAHSA